jgi:hypothetical protein
MEEEIGVSVLSSTKEVERKEYTESKVKLVIRMEGIPADLAAMLFEQSKWKEKKKREKSRMNRPSQERCITQHASRSHFYQPFPFNLYKIILLAQKCFKNLNAFLSVDAIPVATHVSLWFKNDTRTHAKGCTITGSIQSAYL